MPNDELSQFLISGGRRRNLSPERLEMMGKEAANLFLSEKTPLTQSVVKIARAEPSINVEQVTRVCEFANTAVYLAHHDMNKTAGSETSYPQFDLADPARAYQELSGTRVSDFSSDLAYTRPPEKAKVSNSKREEALAELFGATRQKVAHVSTEMAVSEVMATKDHLTSLFDHLRSSFEQIDLMHKEASESYYDTVKRHLLEGESFTDVVNAATHAGVDSVRASAVLSPMALRLVEEKVAKVEKLAAQNTPEELDKVAHRIVDMEHPLVTGLQSICNLEETREKFALALDEVETELSTVQTFIRENFLRAGRAS